MFHKKKRKAITASLLCDPDSLFRLKLKTQTRLASGEMTGRYSYRKLLVGFSPIVFLTSKLDGCLINHLI